MNNQMTMPEVCAQYELIATLECRQPESFRPISGQFEYADAFTVFVDKSRKWKVRQEGWRCAVISTDVDINRTGVFHPVLELLLDKSKLAGGVSMIIPAAEMQGDGKIVFSAPWNTNAMLDFDQRHRVGGHLVAIDVYSDGTSLSRSGSQSANAMSVSFSNIRGITDVWYEVGIVPSVYCADKKFSDAEKRRERLEIFQRFLFVVFKDLISASFDGVLFQGTTLFPRMIMTVADQPQEIFFCLKSTDSFCRLLALHDEVSSSRKAQTGRRRFSG